MSIATTIRGAWDRGSLVQTSASLYLSSQARSFESSSCLLCRRLDQGITSGEIKSRVGSSCFFSASHPVTRWLSAQPHTSMRELGWWVTLSSDVRCPKHTVRVEQDKYKDMVDGSKKQNDRGGRRGGRQSRSVISRARSDQASLGRGRYQPPAPRS